jgi:glycosyltransferase involved in cell wall biosynthesis
MREQLIQAFRPKQIEVVRSGVDHDTRMPVSSRAAVREKYGITQNALVILCLSILMRHRRLEDAIEAVALIQGMRRDVRLLLVGASDADPDYAAILKDLINERRVNGIATLVGGVSEEEVASLFGACDIFLFPNEDQTWGLAVIEAMSCGMPAIVSTGAGVHEVLEDGSTAFLVPPRSPAVIADAILRISQNPDEARRVAAAGQAFVRRNFSWARYATDMAKVFERARLTSAAPGASRR